jgi:hypothetical protein
LRDDLAPDGASGSDDEGSFHTSFSAVTGMHRVHKIHGNATRSRRSAVSGKAARAG